MRYRGGAGVAVIRNGVLRAEIAKSVAQAHGGAKIGNTPREMLISRLGPRFSRFHSLSLDSLEHDRPEAGSRDLSAPTDRRAKIVAKKRALHPLHVPFHPLFYRSTFFFGPQQDDAVVFQQDALGVMHPVVFHSVFFFLIVVLLP